jgi:hypothetical protein
LLQSGYGSKLKDVESFLDRLTIAKMELQVGLKDNLLSIRNMSCDTMEKLDNINTVSNTAKIFKLELEYTMCDNCRKDSNCPQQECLVIKP